MDVQQIHKFLNGLTANNSKAWMDENKKDYQSAKSNFIDLVQNSINTAAKFDDEIVNEEAKKCVFRLNRDVRFSKNKDPYKTNFGGSICKGGRKTGNPGYYLHIMPGNNFAGGGLFQPQPDALKKICQEIDYNAPELVKIITSAKFKRHFNEPFDDKVKTAPKGYPKDHPHIDLLRYRSFIYTQQFTDKEAQSPDFPKMIVETFKVMKPYIDFLRRGLD
ncbi:MAG: DUF2461 domain-containing protein [Cytophagales bacterium]|nr:DUF2461 domain-containing protein [Cytophagales bacterium]